MSMEYLHFSVFHGSEQRHGGTKRSEQLAGVLSELGVQTLNPYLGLKRAMIYSLKHPVILLESSLFASYLFIFKGLSLKGLISFSFKSVSLIVLLRNNAKKVLIHETAPGISLIFMQYLKFRKIPFIVVPHNIEFMVPNQKISFFRNLSFAFSCEIDGYNSAANVKVICDYDKSILACLGINSSVFPYYPIKKDEDYFLSIRRSRRQREFKKTLLLLGSVGNIPTYDGVKAFLDTFKISKKSYKLIVAGYGTEQFKDYESDKITVLGTVENDKLKELLINTEALVINQPQTTGFLTKIVEFNLSGIPVYVVSDYVQSANLQNYGIYKLSIKDLESHRLQPPKKFFEAKPFNLYYPTKKDKNNLK